MEYFAIVGYALFYISAFILKTEYERQTHEKPVYENNLMANSIPLSLGGLLYSQGVIKLMKMGEMTFGKHLPCSKLTAAFLTTLIIFVPFITQT